MRIDDDKYKKKVTVTKNDGKEISGGKKSGGERQRFLFLSLTRKKRLGGKTPSTSTCER